MVSLRFQGHRWPLRWPLSMAIVYSVQHSTSPTEILVRLHVWCDFGCYPNHSFFYLNYLYMPAILFSWFGVSHHCRPFSVLRQVEGSLCRLTTIDKGPFWFNLIRRNSECEQLQVRYFDFDDRQVRTFRHFVIVLQDATPIDFCTAQVLLASWIIRGTTSAR